MTKIDIFSGFLGAGKTTLIKKLVKEAYNKEKIVLIENEFGEIGIDGGFMQEAGITVNEMNSGCICCSLVGDFSKALKEVYQTYRPDRIIIEPSGVGKLSDVIKAVVSAGLEGVKLNTFCTVVDASKCKMYMKNFGEFFLDQVENASCIVLSHTQKVPFEKLQNAISLLKEKNATATLITSNWADLNGTTILSAMEQTNSLEAELQCLQHEVKRRHKHHHDEDCDCDCHEHHHDEECDCGGHEHHHDEDCDCDCHEHHHDEECGCGGHEHHHDEECGCGGHEHHHDEDCDCGCHEHHHDEDCDCGGHEHHHDEDCDCDCHEHHHDEECDCGCQEHHHDEDCDCGCHEHHHDEDCGGHKHHHHHHAEEVFTSWGKETAKTFTKEDIINTLENFSDEKKFGIILRAKGIVQGENNKWLHFDYIPNEIDVREGSADVTGRLCVIGCRLNQEAIEKAFNL